MAQTEDASTTQKRRPGRPSKTDARFEKKRKISTTISTPITSSVPSSPAPEKQPTKLPSKTSSHAPLPTLTQPQAALLPAGEYQSIAASGVLQTSLDRSRLKWINEGVLERYWVKPESGKAAKNAPPTTLPNGKVNPDLKWQKHKGPCRIRVEPHIFECEVYVEEKVPAVKPQPVRQYAPPHQQAWQGGGGGSAYGQPYRPGQNQQVYGGQQQQQYYQSRTLPPIQQQQQHPHHMHGSPNAPPPQSTLPPLAHGAAQSPPPRAQQSSPAQSQHDKKASPDPVISMLATRASSDPELKALMKEVATGNASQEQLKVFQGHIDELTKLLADEKKRKDEEPAAAATSAEDSTGVGAHNQGEVIQYDGAADNMTPRHPGAVQQPYHQTQPQQQPYAPVYQPQQTWQPPPPPPPAAPASLPVILAFTTPGSTEDRFLFPQNSILESLSPQHLLASFIVTRKSSVSTTPAATTPHHEAAETDTNDKNTAEVEYWEPVTLMVEVAYNREHILECVKRWVRPAEDVRKYMEEVMERCTRASEVFLPLRLPVKGSRDAMTSAEEESSGMGTPVRVLEERPRKTYVKRALKNEAGRSEKKDGAPVDVGEKKNESVSEPAKEVQVPAATEVKAEDGGKAPEATDGGGEKLETTETGRPRRATRKSVRISEG